MNEVRGGRRGDERWCHVLHAPFLETPAADPSARVRPRVRNGGGSKVGNRDEKDATSGSVATLHTPILETPAAGPSARVRPIGTDGGSVKADDQSDVEDARPEMGICHRQSAKYDACDTAGRGPKDKHAFGGATTRDQR